MKSLLRLILAGWLLGASAAYAQLTIEITKGIEGAQPVAVVPFGTSQSLPADMAAIISDDLQRSGRFRTLSPQSYSDRPTDISQINYNAWRSRGTDYVVVGNVRPGNSGYDVNFQLADVAGGNQLLGATYNVPPKQLRQLAHHIADQIYEKLTGERGAFNTRIAYVTAVRQGGAYVYMLVVADSDGHNPQMVLRSNRPIMSPAWSPNGRQLAYVSFEKGTSQIVVQDVFSGARQVVSSSPGINGAPAWSPDGKRLAMTLSKDGNPEIYVYNLASRSLVRLTNSTAIDTEPAWSPDGASIIFTSDRGGAPQIYRVSASGGEPQRLTYEGDYNARGSLSPDGRYMTMVHRRGGKFYIGVMDMQTRKVRPLTEGGLDESPSFAPNGRMIIYATSKNGNGVLSAVSVDGAVQQTLFSRGSEVREPVWSPFNR